MSEKPFKLSRLPIIGLISALFVLVFLFITTASTSAFESDFGIVESCIGDPTLSNCTSADLDGDGSVGEEDLIMLSNAKIFDLNGNGRLDYEANTDSDFDLFRACFGQRVRNKKVKTSCSVADFNNSGPVVNSPDFNLFKSALLLDISGNGIVEYENDNELPEVSLLYPKVNERVSKDGFTVAGTASDNGWGIEKVRVSIFDRGRNSWFVENAVFNEMEGTWSINVPSASITPGFRAAVSVTAFDKANNMKSGAFAFDVNVSTERIALSSLVDALPDKFESVLTNPKIQSAFVKNLQANTLFSQDLLYMESLLSALVNSGGNSWATTISPSSEINESWLKQAAISIYTEANSLVPWVLGDYSDENLELIFSRRNIFSDLNRDALLPLLYGFDEVIQRYSDALTSPEQLLKSIVMTMRDEGWVHRLNTFSYQNECGLPTTAATFECLRDVKKGTSSYTPGFIHAVLSAFNVPSERINPYLGHGGILFPTLSLAMDGDEVYASFTAGISRRPNKIPIENSFVDLATALAWNDLPFCEGKRAETRNKVFKYLSLYENPLWNEDIIAAFTTVSPPDFTKNGDWLRFHIIESTRPESCESTEVSLVSDWPQTLSDEEITEWFQKIESVL